MHDSMPISLPRHPEINFNPPRDPSPDMHAPFSPLWQPPPHRSRPVEEGTRKMCTVPWSDAQQSSCDREEEGEKARPEILAGVDPLRKACAVLGLSGECTLITVPFCEADARKEPLSFHASTAWTGKWVRARALEKECGPRAQGAIDH